MKTSKVFATAVTMFLFILLLSACNSEQVESPPIDEPVVEPTVVQNTEPTAEPSPVPEIEAEIIDLGYDAKLLVRGLPDDVILDANVDLEMKENMPALRNADHIQTEVVVINITKNGEKVSLDKGIVELCFTTTLSPANLTQPKPYYWDTSISPLVDGRGLRLSTQEKGIESDLVVCTMVQNNGAYAFVAW